MLCTNIIHRLVEHELSLIQKQNIVERALDIRNQMGGNHDRAVFTVIRQNRI